MSVEVEGEIKVGDMVEWLHTFLYGTQRVRRGKVVRVHGAFLHVHTRHRSPPILVPASKVTKIAGPRG